jgi:hypothetical protein
MAEKRMTLQAQRSRYFQEIAATFFRLRGAPFVLSSGDVMIISGWEDTGIPLGVVEEGIRRAYENSRKNQPARGKISSLAFCDREVRRAFHEHRERRVGRNRTPATPEKKAERAKGAVRNFLKAPAGEVEYLRNTYEEALGLLNRRGSRDADLERLDEEAERLILGRAGTSDRADVENRVRADFPGCSPDEYERLAAVQLIRRVREKYGIPHLGLFYY